MRPRSAIGLALVGYAGLVGLGLVAHEADWVAYAAGGVGLLILLWPWLAQRPAHPRGPASARSPHGTWSGPRRPDEVAPQAPGHLTQLVQALRGLLPTWRSRGIAAAGAFVVVAVCAYEGWTRNGLSRPELGLLADGLLMAAAAPVLAHRLGRVSVATMVGWSFPLVLAPLSLFALNALLSEGSTALAPAVEATVVRPTHLALLATGSEVERSGSALALATPRGTLSLGVGLVCAGLYPMVLFGSLVALHGWQHKVPPKRLAAVLAAGLAGLWLVNLLRLVILAKVGVRYGADALQSWHDQLGWVLFALSMVAFWSLAAPWLRGARTEDDMGPAAALHRPSLPRQPTSPRAPGVPVENASTADAEAGAR